MLTWRGRRFCTRWVPKLQCANRVGCCEELLENYNQDSAGFFGRLVTRNEAWIHHYDPLSQQEAKSWKKANEKTPNPTTTSHTIDWQDHHHHLLGLRESVLLIGFLPRVTTINGPYHPSLLHRLHSSIREKLVCDVLLLHDNAPVHKSNITQVAIRYTCSTELNYLAYSPDLAASDCHLFSNLKNFLRGKNFESDNNRESQS